MRSTSKKRLSPINALGGRSREAARGTSRHARKNTQQLSRDEVTVFLRNLATLCGNGVSLPKAIGAIAEERGLEKRRGLLQSLRRRVESGDTFSHVLENCGASFDRVTISQIRVGERAGALADTLNHVAEQREKAGKVREDVLKKLAYPAVLALVGTGVVGFLLGYVVPVFEETYRSAKVPLPGITQTMIVAGDVVQGYWWALLITVAVAVVLLQQLRRSEPFARRFDEWVLTLPVVGPWLRDIALLQLMEVIGSLMEAGFTLAEALDEAADSVRNRAMKSGVTALHNAVQRGERFSREVERQSELFPPIVSRLIIVGEQTGKLTRSTRNIRDHLQDEIKRKSDLAIGIIEPTLTISMAAAVAVILLAIYLPMFDMINTVGI